MRIPYSTLLAFTLLFPKIGKEILNVNVNFLFFHECFYISKLLYLSGSTQNWFSYLQLAFQDSAKVSVNLFVIICYTVKFKKTNIYSKRITELDAYEITRPLPEITFILKKVFSKFFSFFLYRKNDFLFFYLCCITIKVSDLEKYSSFSDITSRMRQILFKLAFTDI